MRRWWRRRRRVVVTARIYPLQHVSPAKRAPYDWAAEDALAPRADLLEALRLATEDRELFLRSE